MLANIIIFMLGICVLLCVWDDGEGFLSTQHYLSSFYYLFLCRCMFWLYDHLQVETYTMEISSTNNTPVVF
jgi:hypothetical protein